MAITGRRWFRFRPLGRELGTALWRSALPGVAPANYFGPSRNSSRIFCTISGWASQPKR